MVEKMRYVSCYHKFMRLTVRNSFPFTSIAISNVDAPTAYNGQIPCSPIDWYRVFEALLAEARGVSIE